MKESNKTVIWLVLIAIIGLLAYSSYIKRNPVIKNVDEKKDIVDEVEAIILETKTEYSRNQLENGISPYDIIYGKGLYVDSENSLKIINESFNDVIVMLIRIGDEKTIRNEYIRSKSEYLLTNIPDGICSIKYYYGKDWNPTRKIKNFEVGGFDNDEQFMLSDQEKDLLDFKKVIEDQYIYYSSYTITLETSIVEGETMNERAISPTDFF